MTSDGFKAVLRLGGGDMRRILNILQATSMAHDVVSEANVMLIHLWGAGTECMVLYRCICALVTRCLLTWPISVIGSGRPRSKNVWPNAPKCN
jgi:hypothetical protein